MPLQALQDEYRIILASNSPRRQQLLKDLGIEFEVLTKPVDEVFPPHLKRNEVAEYLAELKANAFDQIGDNILLITADTIVCVDEEVLGKPKDRDEAVEMLEKLSDRSHTVITGVTLKTNQFTRTFSESTKVHFKKLTSEEITHYIDNYLPFDKAGSYGIQEWIGYVGITGIEGDYFNVVGLCVGRLYGELGKI